ncbi:TPA: 2-oxoacid:ferredoxin oxidoreductase subunit beta [Candidatus Poribacteria bacterium]|nr:2-oxoacid:ferredoxin oxidoreductase subunit beta [Candidatus Poribacteria bacterium]
MAQRAAKDYRGSIKPIWCPGCGHYGILSAIYQGFSNLNLNPSEVVVVSGIGCSGRLPGYLRTYGFHGVHGRALPLATGVKIANPKLTVLVAGGDGDSYSIGAGHIPHAARRNADLTYIVMNNGVYSLTKGQHSPTSSPQLLSKQTQLRPLQDALNPIAFAVACDVSFVARGYSHARNELADLIIQAIQHKGFALIDVLSPCPTFNRVQTSDFYRNNIVPIASNHDAADKFQAFIWANETGKIPVGIFYKVRKPTLQERLEERRIQSGREEMSMRNLFEKFY